MKKPLFLFLVLIMILSSGCAGNKTIALEHFGESVPPHNDTGSQHNQTGIGQKEQTFSSPKFLNEAKTILAVTSQQRLLEKLAFQTGLNVLRVQVDKPKYMKKLLTITTRITVRSTLRNLTRFVHMLESNKKFMIIEEVLARRTNKTDLEELQSQLTISGFIKKVEEKKDKTI